MNLRQLSCFVAIVDEGSFTRAARRLGIASRRSRSRSGRSRPSSAGDARAAATRRRLTPAGRRCCRRRGRRSVPPSGAGSGAPTALGLEAGELEIATVLSMAVGCCRATSALARAASGRRHPPARVPAPQAARGRGRAGRRRLRDRAAARAPWDGPFETVAWEEFVIVVAARPTRSQARRHDPAGGTRRPRMGALQPGPRPGRNRRGDLPPRRLQPRGTVRTSQAEGAARLAAAGLGPALVPDNIVLPGIGASALRLEPR